MENPPNGNFKVEFEASETWKDLKPLDPLNCVKVDTSIDELEPKKSKKEDDKRTFDCDKCKRKFPLEWYFKAHLCTDVTRLKQLLRCKICSKKCQIFCSFSDNHVSERMIVTKNLKTTF